MKNIEANRIRLINMRERYFRSVIAHQNGHLVHFGDCDIYRSVDVYGSAWCTCGFLRDLQNIEETLREKLHPRYEEELDRQNGPELTEEEKVVRLAEIQKSFTEFGFEHLHIEFGFEHLHIDNDFSILDQFAENAEEFQLIEDVFGKVFRDRKELEWHNYVDKQRN